MAIDPSLINTIQTKDLPPAAISFTDNFAHEVGDILSRATIQELVDFIRAQSTSYQYEIKYIRVPNPEYITDNFDMTPNATQGIGIAEGIWNGWAICNGNNGTDNLDGQVLMGYGANHLTVGQFLGSATHTLTEAQLPALSKPVTLPVSDAENSGGTKVYVNATDVEPAGNHSYAGAVSFGGGQSHNNIQPSMVILIIMKI